MDFKQTLLLIINEFNKNIEYGLIGGFAIGLFGCDRATTDLDFLINVKDIDKLKDILCKNGYELLFQSENVLQFVSPIKDFGEIDVLIAKREISLNMLKNVIKKAIFNNTININVLLPEDIIALKLQAIKNNKEREFIDENDIKYLLKNISLDIDKIRNYAKMLNMEDYFENLMRKVKIGK